MEGSSMWQHSYLAGIVDWEHPGGHKIHYVEPQLQAEGRERGTKGNSSLRGLGCVEWHPSVRRLSPAFPSDRGRAIVYWRNRHLACGRSEDWSLAPPFKGPQVDADVKDCSRRDPGKILPVWPTVRSEAVEPFKGWIFTLMFLPVALCVIISAFLVLIHFICHFMHFELFNCIFDCYYLFALKCFVDFMDCILHSKCCRCRVPCGRNIVDKCLIHLNKCKS